MDYLSDHKQAPMLSYLIRIANAHSQHWNGDWNVILSRHASILCANFHNQFEYAANNANSPSIPKTNLTLTFSSNLHWYITININCCHLCHMTFHCILVHRCMWRCHRFLHSVHGHTVWNRIYQLLKELIVKIVM